MNATPFFRASPELAVPGPSTLADCLRLVPDPRIARTRKHALGDILAIAVCAILCGYNSFYDMELFGRAYWDWLRGWLRLDGGVPSHDTFRRVLGLVNPHFFNAAFRLWTNSTWGRVGDDLIALDGKGLRGSVNSAGSIQYIVNAWSARRHVVLGQVKVQDKTNEIVAIPQLLPMLDIRGALVSIDAIGCQTKIAALVRELGGDYLLALKGNNPLAFEEIEHAMLDAVAHGDSHLEKHETLEKNHGRVERRTCWVSRQTDWFADKGRWKDLCCFVMVEATRTVRGKQGATDRRLYLCSRNLTAKEALEATRAHWGVESMHWTLDIVFDEDRSRVRTANAAENLATIRRIALNLLRSERDKEPDPAKRPRLRQLMRRAARDDAFREHLVWTFGREQAQTAPTPQERS